MSDFSKEVFFRPAFDKRHDNPKKNYGIGGVTIKFILKKDNKAVQFLLGTNWYLPSTVTEYKIKGVPKNNIAPFDLRVPEGNKSFSCWDLGYHSPDPMYEGDTPISDNCDIIEGDCYYHGSGLNSEKFHDILLSKGSDGVWEELEKDWNIIFNNGGEL